MRSVDELKTVFLATASHELRTPVTAIVGFSALLLQHWDTMSAEQSRGLVERVHANSKRLEALTEQLLDFAQLERGLPRSDDRVIDLGRDVGQILADQSELASGHQLDTYLTPRLHRSAARARPLERIVTNLVGNAAKYAPPGTQISVTVRTEGDRAVLLVDDEGPGVRRGRPRTDLQPLLPRPRRLGEPHPRGRRRPRDRRRIRRVDVGDRGVRSAPSGGARFSDLVPGRRPHAVRLRRPEAAAGLEGTADVALS